MVYIDGKLVFNGTTTDDLSLIIYNLMNLISGNHEIKVIFTDNNGNIDNYTENITVSHLPPYFNFLLIYLGNWIEIIQDII